MCWLSFIWRCHHYRWRTANFDLSMLGTSGHSGFFSVPHLLCHGTSVYNGHLRFTSTELRNCLTYKWHLAAKWLLENNLIGCAIQLFTIHSLWTICNFFPIRIKRKYVSWRLKHFICTLRYSSSKGPDEGIINEPIINQSFRQSHCYDKT